MSSKSRIPKAPAAVAPGKPDRLQSSLCETKLPMIKPTIKNSKVQSTTPSSASNCNSSLTSASLGPGPGTKLRRTNSSLAESNTTKISSSKNNETKLRRVNSNLTETKRPKSQILMTVTKLPKLQQNPSELKPSKIGSGKLQQLETGDMIKEAKGCKKTDKSKLPRIQPLSLPLKEINTELSPVEMCKESLLGNFKNMDPSIEHIALAVEPLKPHVISLPPKVSKTTEDSSKMTQGTDAKAGHLKASTLVTSTKLPKALPVTNTLPKSLKIRSTNTKSKTLPIIKSPTPNTTLERKLPKTQLSLNGLKSKPTESKLPKTPTTPDETKLPRALPTGVAATNASEMRHQKTTIRR